MEPVGAIAAAGALSGAGAAALWGFLRAVCQFARRSRVTDLSLFWGLVRVRRDPLDGEEIRGDAEAEEGYGGGVER